MTAFERDTMCRHGRRAILLVAVAALGALGTQQASRAGDDHDAAVRGAPVASVMQLLERVRQDFTGDVLEIELEDEDGGPAYEVKLLTPQGNVLKIYYDARTLDVLEVKGRHDDHDGETRGREGRGS